MPWASMYLFARNVLHMNKIEFMQMTLREFVAIQREWRKQNCEPEEELAWADDIL